MYVYLSGRISTYFLPCFVIYITNFFAECKRWVLATMIFGIAVTVCFVFWKLAKLELAELAELLELAEVAYQIINSKYPMLFPST